MWRVASGYGPSVEMVRPWSDNGSVRRRTPNMPDHPGLPPNAGSVTFVAVTRRVGCHSVTTSRHQGNLMGWIWWFWQALESTGSPTPTCSTPTATRSGSSSTPCPHARSSRGDPDAPIDPRDPRPRRRTHRTVRELRARRRRRAPDRGVPARTSRPRPCPQRRTGHRQSGCTLASQFELRGCRSWGME